MIRIERFLYENKELIRLSNDIRTTVFINEQNVAPEIEYEFEEEGHYYLLFYKEKPIATCRWRKTENGIKLERFALLKEFRNRGLGNEILVAIMSDVIPMGEKIYLHSQVTAINYYKRAGFVEEGEHFWEAEIEHVKMTYKKTV